MFDESKHPRADDGKFTDGAGKTYRQNTGYNDILEESKREEAENIYKSEPQSIDEDNKPKGEAAPKKGKSKAGYNSQDDFGDLKKGVKKATDKKMTPAEKIASVHIDFTKDNILPELNEEDLVEVGSKINKPVLLKKNIINLNELHHDDLSLEDSEKIIKEALYSEKKEIFPSKHKNKPNYYTFAKIVRQSRKDNKPIYGVTLLDVDGSKENFEIVHWHFVPYDKIDSVKPKK